MNKENKSALIDIINDTPRGQSLAESIVNKLEEIGAINPFWTSKTNKRNGASEGLPETFRLVSPMYQGFVHFVERDEFVGYIDADGTMRLREKSRKKLAKKVAKYNLTDN